MPQGWFYRTFVERGVSMEGGLYMWEVTKHDPVKIFSQLPKEVLPLYHW